MLSLMASGETDQVGKSRRKLDYTRGQTTYAYQSSK